MRLSATGACNAEPMMRAAWTWGAAGAIKPVANSPRPDQRSGCRAQNRHPPAGGAWGLQPSRDVDAERVRPRAARWRRVQIGK